MRTLEKFCFGLFVVVLCLIAHKLWHRAIDLGDAQRKADQAPIEFTVDALTLTNPELYQIGESTRELHFVSPDGRQLVFTNEQDMAAFSNEWHLLFLKYSAHRTNRVLPGVRTGVNTNRFPLIEP